MAQSRNISIPFATCGAAPLFCVAFVTFAAPVLCFMRILCFGGLLASPLSFRGSVRFMPPCSRMAYTKGMARRDNQLRRAQVRAGFIWTNKTITPNMLSVRCRSNLCIRFRRFPS
jgi:hypothetical protein